MPLKCQLDRYDVIDDIQDRELGHDNNTVGVLGMTRESILKQQRTEKRMVKEDKANRRAIGRLLAESTQ